MKWVDSRDQDARMGAFMRRGTGILAAFVIAASADYGTPGQATTGAGEAGTVMRKVREAVGLSAIQGLGAVRVRGSVERLGTRGTYTLDFRPSGEFVLRTDSALGDAAGFDGREGWAVDWSGMPRPLELEDLEINQLCIWVQTGRWLADGGPFEVELLEKAAGEGPIALGLKLKGGRVHARLEVDRSSWLPVSMRCKRPTGTLEVRYADYRSDLGFRFPGRTTDTMNGMTSTFVVQSITAMEGDLQSVPARPRDARFSAGISPEVAVKRAPTGHRLARPRIDGADLGWFILDTGAGQSVITPAAADGLRQERIGEVVAATIMGTAPTGVRRGKSLELGPVRIARPYFIEMDLGFLTQALGEEITGIVGYDLFSRCVTELDLGRDKVRLFDPDAYRGEELPWREMIIHQKLPAAKARFEGGREGIFRLDIGAGGAFGNVVFNAPAVKEMNLMANWEGARRLDLGGREYAAGRVAWLEIGGRRLENLQSMYALAEEGPMADPYLAGNIGAHIIEAYRIVLDYLHKRIAFLERSPEGS